MAGSQPADDQPGQQHLQHGGIELVPDDRPDDSDSALSVPLTNSLTSLRSSILEYHIENGRTYHAMSAGKYLFPNDDAEIERLDLQHYLIRMTLGDNRLCLCPKNEGAKRVLDLGTGTGIWSIEYADQHPEAEVIGVDLSPVQPNLFVFTPGSPDGLQMTYKSYSVPPNCSFEVDDLEKEWTWSKPFDFILSRMMNGSFADNAAIVKKVYDQLEPGGYFETQDMAAYIGCDDGTLADDSDLKKFMSVLVEAMNKAGRPLAAGQKWKSFMEEAGFEDVVEVTYKWPTNTWPREKKYKTLGRWSLANMDQVLDMALLAPLTRVLGWTREEAIMLAAKTRKVLRDPTVHAYWPIYVVYGRKPLKRREQAPAA